LHDDVIEELNTWPCYFLDDI